MFYIHLDHDYLKNNIKNIENRYIENIKNKNAGVDLIISETVTIPANSRGYTINHKFKVAYKPNNWYNFILHYIIYICKLLGYNDYADKFKTYKQYNAYWACPRSSISKTPLRLSNNIGLIDASYRGDIIAKVDNLSDQDYVIEEGISLFQLVSPDLGIPIIKFVDSLDKTNRGEGGFGSTGNLNDNNSKQVNADLVEVNTNPIMRNIETVIKNTDNVIQNMNTMSENDGAENDNTEKVNNNADIVNNNTDSVIENYNKVLEEFIELHNDKEVEKNNE